MNSVTDASNLIATTAGQPQTRKLSAAEQPVVTKSFTGRFRNLRFRLAGGLALLYFLTSWLSWNGRQAVLWDLEARKFYIFEITLVPQDLILLAFLMMVGAFGLLASNLLVGRAWCGYTCPQSVWTWAFMWAEKTAEGDRNQRIKLNGEAWSLSKLSRRTLKHVLWLTISVATGMAFVGYFVPIRDLSVALLTGDWFTQAGFWTFSFALVTYVNAGWLREKVCLHMCPYSRLQSVMFDKDTLVVTYETARGENRGSRKKDSDHKAIGLGDCLDCYQCVQVCPTGIDIRDGLQIDCIGCGACIDACDSVMDKMNYPRGLIHYTSERAQAGEPRRVMRPLVWAYGAVLLVMLATIVFMIKDRELVSLSVVKDRGAHSLRKLNTDGLAINVYLLKIVNKTQQQQSYSVSLDDANGLELDRPYRVIADPGEMVALPVRVRRVSSQRSADVVPFHFVVTGIDQEEILGSTKAIFASITNKK